MGISDGMFFTLVIGFFFVVWVATGGPSRPISFAGAYITPITNVGATSTGYGPQVTLGGALSAAGTTVSVSDKSATPVVPASVYKNQIIAARTTAYSSKDPNNQYVHVVLTSKDQQPVRLSNWRFVSVADNATVIISNEDASIAPGTSIVVVTSFPASTPHDTIQLEDSGSKIVSSFTY